MTTNGANMNTNATHVVTLDGETIAFNAADYQSVCDALVARHPGCGVPRIEPIAQPEPVRAAVAALVATAPTMPTRTVDSVTSAPAAPVGGSTVCLVGAARSQTDYDTAVAAGFAPRQPLFTRGTRVNETGVDNARRSREKWLRMPLVAHACGEIVSQIEREQRADEPAMPVSNLRVTKTGELFTGMRKLLLTERALSGLCSRIPGEDGSPIGGASYLARCKPELRAINLNHHCRDLGEREALLAANDPEFKPAMTVLRTRRNGAGREVFAAVSPNYSAFDVDRVAAALALAAPSDARGTVAYDGTRAKFELVYHSDVDASEYVAGEFFKVAVRVRTDDTGRGGLNVSAAIFQNLCLNLIVIDCAEQRIDSLRHFGSVEKLAAKFQSAFARAMNAVRPFMVQWGAAAHEDVIARAVASQQLDGPIPLEDALPGFFNGMIERELVPVRGRRPDAIAGLVQMYHEDTSGARSDSMLTRAALVNAVTRYAHTVEADPFQGARMEEAAGRIVSARAPMPYVALS